MSIEAELTSRLKNAMKARDGRVLGVIRAIKTEATKLQKHPKFSGEVDDDFYLKIIAGYVKRMTKAVAEFEKAGEKGKDRADVLRFEIDYLDEFLPKKLDDAATRKIVEATIEQSGATAKKDIGRVMGMVMKDHRETVDASLVRSIADSLLND